MKLRTSFMMAAILTMTLFSDLPTQAQARVNVGPAGLVSGGGSITVYSNSARTSEKFKLTAASGDLRINTNKFTVAGATGDTLIARDLAVTRNVAITGTLAVTSTQTLTGNTTFGAGYGTNGALLTAATGAFQTKGAITTDAALTADNIVCTNAATFGGGAGATGCTISTAGAITADSTITTGASGSNGGLTVKATGGSTTLAVTGSSGALDTVGAVTIGPGGNGYTTSGTTLTAAGAISAKGALTVDGASTLTGALILGSTAVGPGGGGIVYTTRHVCTLAEVNAGHEILPAVTGRKYRMVNCKIFTGGHNLAATAAATGLSINGTQTTGKALFTALLAACTADAVCGIGSANTSVLPDTDNSGSPSFLACDAATAITVKDVSAGNHDLITSHEITVILDYTIE